MNTLQCLIYSLIHHEGIRGDRRDIATALVEKFSDGLYDIRTIDSALKRLVELGYVNKELQKSSGRNRNMYSKGKKISPDTV